MSYVVLARKYRPPNFGALVGQPHVVQALGNALRQQRLHHAYLFTGTRGVGKTTIARILAKSLNCTGPDGRGGITAEPCGVCEACRDIDAGRYVDYVELDAASNRGVDEISRLLDQSVYKPVVARFKVYLIDEVHMLSNTAFNAMLKTLEEPPPYLKFVLATTDPQKVPATVLSRCLQFNLRPMAPETIREHLADVLGREAIDAEPAALTLIARAARGSMRDALSLTDQAVAFGAGAVSEEGVRQMLGAVDRGHAARIVAALAARDGAGLVAAVDALRELGLAADALLEEMATLLQQMALQQAVPGALDADDPDAAPVAELAALLPADETQLLYSIVLHGRTEIALAPDEYSGLVMVLLRLLAFPPAGAATGGASAGSTGSPRQGRDAAASPVAVAAAAPRAVKGPGSSDVLAGALPPGASSARPAGGTSGPLEAPGAPGRDRREAARSGVEADAPALPTSAARSATAPLGAAEPPAPRGAGAALDARPLRAAATVLVEPRARAAATSSEEAPGDRMASARDRAPGASGASDEGSGSDSGSAAGPAAPTTAPSDPGQHLSGDHAGADPGSAEPMSDAAAARAPARAPDGIGAPADRWDAVVRRMLAAGSIGALVRELALQAECIAVDESASPLRWQLRVEREMLRTPAQCERLQSALAEMLGRPVRIDVEAGVAEDTPARRAAAERARRQSEAERLIAEDPLVKALMAQYKTARIVPGSVKPHSTLQE
ncbi:DNA polymerase III subunit gamma/tau [Piscinibacter koreensis]|uniref:DNA polymerase III subunit gamma/tau n=1 Tax=Piscinibacter koreensis TaxID=2742824 RepID=A0A7Y6NR84_9BURK|nr:DNA polymerase III subunit gamma/tau [Schlegelella koreensis]NUZ07732.1 DNA polymerase III subunit gamma/tau [Schlegelella koreensis]